MSFWGELKRRNVFKVGVAYAIVAWLIIEAVATIFPVLQLPEWSVTLVTVLVIIGFPLALIFAWAFEITPDGIKLTKEVPRAESITRLTGKKLNYIVIGLLILAVAYIIFDKVYIDRRAIEPEQAPVIKDVEEAAKTIAVIPFVNLSPDPDQEYFVDGLSEELLNKLTQISDLRVTSRTSSFSFKGTDKKVQEIANDLGVTHILEGSVRKAGNALRITAQLIRAADDIHLWSKTYDRELKDIFVVQEDIANAVADELKLKLGIGKSFKQLGGTNNLEAYEIYLVAKGQSYRWELFQALESIDAAIALDSGFALAWALKGLIHSYFAAVGSADQISLNLDKALEAAQRAIEIEPDLGKAYLSLGYAHTYRGEFIKAEKAYRKGIELTTEQRDYWRYGLTLHYTTVGYLRKCYELLGEARQNDPLDPAIRGWYISFQYFFSSMEEIEEEIERCTAIFGNQWWRAVRKNLLLFNGKETFSINEIREILEGDDITEIDSVAKKHIASPEDGLVELHRLYNSSDKLSLPDFRRFAGWATYFGDLEFALDAMERSSLLIKGGITYWAPLYKEVRQLPRFKGLMREIGLVDYWKEYGWPDLCRPVGDDDFECD